MRKACSAFRTCSGECRAKKRECKAQAASDKHTCLAECAKKHGHAKRKCKRACRKEKRSEKSECRKLKRSCKDVCRKEFKSGACASSRMKFWTQVTGAKNAVKGPGVKQKVVAMQNTCNPVYR